jgi:hypothetical protein
MLFIDGTWPATAFTNARNRLSHYSSVWVAAGNIDTGLIVRAAAIWLTELTGDALLQQIVSRVGRPRLFAPVYFVRCGYVAQQRSYKCTKYLLTKVANPRRSLLMETVGKSKKCIDYSTSGGNVVLHYATVTRTMWHCCRRETRISCPP